MSQGAAICSYGCGQEALFEIGKRKNACCSEKFTSCPAYRRKLAEGKIGSSNGFYGKKHSEEVREYLSEVNKGERNAFFGKRHTEEALEKLRKSLRAGFANGRTSPTAGTNRPKEVREKISRTRRENGVCVGENNPNWRGGGRTIREFEAEYIEWRTKVFSRDQFTCQHCGQHGGDLEAHHIKPWALFPEIRFEVNNGLTLCLKCHKTTFKEVKKWREVQKIGGPSTLTEL